MQPEALFAIQPAPAGASRLADPAEHEREEPASNGDAARQPRPDETAQTLAAIVESSDDAILSKNVNGIITSWNQGAQRIFGYTAEEAIGKPVAILIPPDRQNEEPGILARLRQGQRID